MTTVNGTLLTPQGSPAANVTVAFVPVDGVTVTTSAIVTTEEVTTTTATDGTFSITLEPANYRVTVSKENETWSCGFNVSVPSGDAVRLEDIVTNSVVYTPSTPFVAVSSKGVAGGVAPLNSSGKVPVGNLPSEVFNEPAYKGAWNANTNSPTLTSGVGTVGWFYIVGTAGTTTLDGISSWSVGDRVYFNGTVWQKIANDTSLPTGNMVYVDSVNGSDETGQRGRLDKPFLTPEAAIAVAQLGDLITVYPGSYTVTGSLAKNGVNWYFHSGASIVKTVTMNDTVPIFNGATNDSYRVEGYGSFTCNTSGGTGIVGVVGASAVVSISAISLVVTGSGSVFGAANGGIIRFNAPFGMVATSAETIASCVGANSLIEINASILYGNLFVQTGGTIRVWATRVFASYISLLGGGILELNGCDVSVASNIDFSISGIGAKLSCIRCYLRNPVYCYSDSETVTIYLEDTSIVVDSGNSIVVDSQNPDELVTLYINGTLRSNSTSQVEPTCGSEYMNPNLTR